jgi:hypothetical protein
MRTFIKLLTLCCARATVAAAVASLLIFASPVSASENDAEHSAETELRCVQEHEQEATGYYDEQACNAQNAAEAADREAVKYYKEQADRARKRAEALDLETEKYYGERE